MKRIISIVLALVLCLFSVSALADSEAYKEAKYSVVRLYGVATPTSTMGLYDASTIWTCTSTAAWTGSAFAVGTPGEPVKYFVTNKHCAPAEAEFAISLYDRSTQQQIGSGTATLPCTCELFLIFNDASTKQTAYLVQRSERTDLALLELNTPTTLRNPIVLRPFGEGELENEKCYVVGFPGSHDVMYNEQADENLESSPEMCIVSEGMTNRVISAAKSGTGGEIFGHTALTSGGNSGGPIVDKNGHLLGVHTWSVPSGQGTLYAVSVNEVIRLLDEERVPYTTVDELNLGNGNIGMYIGIATGAAVLVVLLVVLLGTRKRKTEFMLVGIAGELRGKAFDLYATTTIGRDSKTQIRYPDIAKGVSNQHCIVNVKDGQVYVTDCSSHGTWIDSTKLEKGAPTPIKQGQTIFLGSAKQGLMLK